MRCTSDWVSQTASEGGRRFYPSDSVRIVTKSNGHTVEVVFSLGNVMLNPETVKFTKILYCVCYGLPTKQNQEEIWDKIILGLLLISRTCSIEKAFNGGKKNPPKAQESHVHCVISLRLSKGMGFADEIFNSQSMPGHPVAANPWCASPGALPSLDSTNVHVLVNVTAGEFHYCSENH